MKPSTLTHAAWALLAAGAYYAGTFHSRIMHGSAEATESKSSALRIAPPGVAATPDSSGKSAGNGKSSEVDSARWLESFRDGNGVVTADRMKEAVTALMRERDPMKFLLNSAALLNELTAENAPAAFSALNENAGDPDSLRFLSMFAHAWGEKDGAVALVAFESLRRREGEMAKSAALAAWAAKDPDAAMSWLQARNSKKDPKADPRQESAFTQGMIKGLARRDVDSALKYLQTLNENQHGEFIGTVVEQKMKDGVAAAAEWAESLPNESMRVTGMEVVGGQFLRRDLESAVKWAEKIAPRADAHEAVADIANEMANRNPQQAAAWVSKLPQGPSQNHAFEDVFENWTRSDPLAASQSLTNMTPGPGRDAAIQAFSGTLARENPADALTWAGAISDPKERVDLQLNIARRWQANAPNEAQAWITANLPPDVQALALGNRKQ